MNKGFVVLHRKITEWEWYSDTNTFRVFLHLLLTANHKPSKFRGFEVGRGQVIIGRKALAKNLHLSEQAVRTSLEHLKSTGEITIESTNRFSIATLIKYGFYQDRKPKSTSKTTSQSTNNQPTINQQVTTSKQCNNINNETNINTPSLFEKSEPVTTKKNEKPKLNGWASWVDVNREYGRPDPAPVGPDLKAAKTIAVNALDRNDLENLYRMFLSDSDAFLAKQGHALRLMPGRINKYINVIEQQPAGFGSTDYEREIIEEIERKVTKQ